MEWIRRHPKRAIALCALLVLCGGLLVAVVGRAGKSPADPTLGAPLAVPTSTPSHAPLTLAPDPTVPPAGPAQGSAGMGLQSSGTGGMPAGMAGSGFARSLTRHHVVVTAGSDSPLAGVGWRIPLADGPRSGTIKSPGTSFRHAATTYGQPDYAQLYTYVGPDGKDVWCTVTVDGRVTDHREAHGPWGQVFCQG